ncbi:MAG: CRISPR-associated protein (Cas_Cas02710) [Pelotomaculum sp. PtaB.Bin104]|nr:MAG: CRISPR-associated protein (Cas_Cas02710) [Pelotomaculum sp. PtaB.Bin104]
MKILFSFVGEQDPYSDKTGEEGSIATLCRYIKPEAVYLFPTAKGLGVKSETQSRAADTETWINSEIDKNIQIFTMPLQLADPTDYSAILPLSRRTIDRVLQELRQVNCEIHLNCSSGTPQLKSTWLFLASAGLFKDCQLWQVANPLFNKENRVNRLEVTFLEEENLLLRIKQYAKEFLFQRMAEECLRLKNISVYSYRKEKAALLYRIFTAYQSWDLTFYEDAYKRLRSVYNDTRLSLDLSVLAQTLEVQVDYLAKLKDNTALENEYNLVDLFMNARRRFIRSDFTDTLSRFWRVYEGTLFMRLRNIYQIEPKDLNKSANKTSIKAIADSGYFYPGFNKLSIRAAETVIANIFKDKVFRLLNEEHIIVNRGESKQSMKLVELLKELRERRNESIVAHGMKSVSGDDAFNSLEVAEAILKKFIPETAVLFEKYPLKVTQVRKVIDVLDKAFTI